MKSIKIGISIILSFCYYNSIAQIFEPERILSRPYIELPQKVITSDLDNDGLLDVVVAGVPPENLSWYKNIGNGVFGDKQILYTAPPVPTEFPPPTTYSVLSKDVDQDGDEDLIAYDCLFFPNILFVETILQKCYWIENLGAGNFGEKHIINVDTSVFSENNNNFYLADWDGDGLEDLIYGNVCKWNKFLGNGNWAATQTITQNNQSFSGDYFLEDINGDGKTDIIGNKNSKLIIGINNGESQIDTIIQLTNYNFFINDLAYSDLDQDGLKDLIVCNKIGGDCYFYLLKNLDNNQFSDTIPIYQQSFGSDGIGELEAADFNNDGLNDLVLFTDRICLLLGIGNAQFSAPIFYCGIGNKIISADLNNDYLFDLIGLENELGSYSRVTAKKFDLTSLFYNTESICFDDYSRYPNFTDIDFDGDLDIYFKMGWYECLSANPIQYSRFKFVANGLFSNFRETVVGVFDFNSDGLKDFIVQRYGNDSLKVLLNNFSDIYTDIVYLQLPLDLIVKSFYEFDFNQDGILDFVIFANNYSTTSTSVLFYMKNAQGVIELVDFHNTDLFISFFESFKFIKTYDINEDDLPDLLLSSNSGIACFINLNDGDFDEPYFLTNETTYNFFIEDFNNDNIPDLIYGQDSIRIKEGLGNGLFSLNSTVLMNDIFAFTFTANDFDLDSDLDIIGTSLIPLEIDSTTGNGISWGVYYKQNSSGQFQNDSLINESPYGVSCFAVDLEGDFDFDLILIDGVFSRSMFINTSNTIAFNKIITNEKDLTVFPNPFTNELNIKFNKNQEVVNIQIYSIDGKLLKESNVKNIESTHIGIELNAGMYLVQLKTNNEIITKKIIKN